MRDKKPYAMSRAEQRKMQQALNASVGQAIDVRLIPQDARDRISASAPTLHPLRGCAEIIEQTPLLVFRVDGPRSEPSRAPAFFPWAWDGFFGAALTLTLFEPAQAARVHLRPEHPTVAALRSGEFLAVLVTAKGALIEAFRASFADSAVARGHLLEQLDNLAGFAWRYDSPETFEIELQAEARKSWTSLELTREERNAIEWADWFEIIARTEVATAEALLPALRGVDATPLPAVIRQTVDAFLARGRLADTERVIDDFVAQNDLRPWIEAMEASADEERWKPCRELASIALRTYMQGPRATQFGKRLPFVSGRTGGVGFLELDLRALEGKIDFATFWARQPPNLRFNWGHLVGGDEVPVSPDIFTRHLSEFPRAESVEDAEVAGRALLAEAVASKQWTIPPRACVQLEIGPFTHVELTEFERDVGVVLRNEEGEFFIASVEPDKGYFGLEVPMLPGVSDDDADAVTAAITMLLAAVVRDFWVVEHREAVFRGSDRGRSPWRGADKDGPRFVYLPRVRYARTLDVARCATELQVSTRREHIVSAHLRKSRQSSAVQQALAQRYGFAVPTGYTFVRPHERGHVKRDVVYRSRSALRSLFSVEGEIDATSPIRWFDFERDVRALLQSLGFAVEHVAASRRGDKGIDVFARKGEDLDEVCWVIQCKCWSAARKVGPDVVRELVGALAAYPSGTRGMIVTTSGFTSGARAEAGARNVRLMDGEEFMKRVEAGAS